MIKSARLRFPQADIHDICYEGRGLDKQLLDELFSCQYIRHHQSIILQGFTGARGKMILPSHGKEFLPHGKHIFTCRGNQFFTLGKQACLNQIKTKYIRLPDLLMEYGDASLISGQRKKLLAKYGRIPLLVIDEWLVSDISDSELYFLFELMERRSDCTATIFCTQYKKEDWIIRFGEGVQAEAIVDCYAHTAFWIETGTMNMWEYCAKTKN